MAAIDTRAPSGDRADVYYSTPTLLLHVRHGQLGDDEGTPQIHIDSVVPFLNIEFEDIANALPVASIGYEYVGMLAMGFLDLVEQALKIFFFRDIALVGGDLSVLFGSVEICHQLGQTGLVGAVCESQRSAVGQKVAST
jgi:hypothetical protein